MRLGGGGGGGRTKPDGPVTGGRGALILGDWGTLGGTFRGGGGGNAGPREGGGGNLGDCGGPGVGGKLREVKSGGETAGRTPGVRGANRAEEGGGGGRPSLSSSKSALGSLDGGINGLTGGPPT